MKAITKKELKVSTRTMVEYEPKIKMEIPKWM